MNETEKKLGDDLLAIQTQVASRWNQIENRLNSMNVEGVVSIYVIEEHGEYLLSWNYNDASGNREFSVRLPGGSWIALENMKTDRRIEMLKYVPKLIQAVIEQGEKERTEYRILLQSLEE